MNTPYNTLPPVDIEASNAFSAVPTILTPPAEPLPKCSPPADSVSALSLFSLSSKIAVVTGGAQGLGFAMATSLCSAGLAGIAILDLNQQVGEAAASNLAKTYNVRAQFYKVDVTNEDNMKQVFSAINSTFGGIDVLICSAGIVANVPAEEYSYKSFQRLLSINLGGSFLSAQCSFPFMKARGGGSIIFIGSMSGKIVNVPQPQIAYNASKAAVIHMMKSFAVEWAQYGIRCNSISPGYMETGLIESFPQIWVQKWMSMSPMERMGKPHELKGVALWLASSASSFVSGTDIAVDGAYTAV
ncbi:uncharacterized protein V1516DRAFT_673640 [Lipomyces oligophaga]|uniref:uncharacterized protein n=1 Tax=Lipomyces oligophaga TaxID=45792 RepID=UPI0034CD961B